MTDASVELWGRQIGAVSWYDDRGIAAFQYTADFAQSNIQVSPVMMPLREAPYEFPSLSRDTFKGLPGMLADCLPDKFGNALIDVWLAQQNRTAKSFNPVERLCYAGTRAMGALEFKPTLREVATDSRHSLDVAELTSLANDILHERAALQGSLFSVSNMPDDSSALEDILRVGTSAGGARAKAVLAWNEKTGEFRSGQITSDPEFTHWLLKFDGVSNNRDKELADPLGYGRIEYAYSLMAKEAGISMMPCRLYEESGRAHFMTKRFDRFDDGSKLHYQSLGALQHYDFNLPGAHSYEQVSRVIRELGLGTGDLEQQIRRTYFNIIARNQDDHVKNIGFVMNKQGDWRLSPAFDLTYSFNPEGDWTSQHQMSLNGKRDGFETEDLIDYAKHAGVKRVRAKKILQQVNEAVSSWSSFAHLAEVNQAQEQAIFNSFRLALS